VDKEITKRELKREKEFEGECESKDGLKFFEK
jgi:hypothetical protein